MEFVVGILSLVLLVWTATGLYKPALAASTPLTRWATSRWRVVGAGLVGLLIVGALAPPPTPEQIAARERDAAARDSADVAERAADLTADRAEERAEEQSQRERAQRDLRADSLARLPQNAFTDAQRAEVRQFNKDLFATLTACDAAGARLSPAQQSGDMVAVYRAAQDLESACGDARRAMRRLTTPSTLPDSLAEDLEEARTSLQLAATMRAEAGAATQRALDSGSLGDMADMTRAADGYQAAMLKAVAGLAIVELSVGIKPDSESAPR